MAKSTIRDRDAAEFLEALFSATIEAGFVLRSFVVPVVPVDTGRLRASIRNETRRNGQRFTAFVGTPVVYAPFVEFRLPFLRLGLDTARPTILELFSQRISEYLRKD